MATMNVNTYTPSSISCCICSSRLTSSSPSSSSQSLSKPFSHSHSSFKAIRFPKAIASSSSSTLLQLQPLHPFRSSSFAAKFTSITAVTAKMATGSVQEVLPPALDSTSEPPSVFDGTTRLYISYTCPFAQRVWITRNCKGLQDKIKLVPIDLQNRPAWYKEKVYSANKVPALEHNNEVKGESLDLIKYIDSHFEGPSLFPDDPAKKEFAEELLSYTDSFSKSVRTSMKGEGVEEAGAAFDYLETALSKFDDGPFFLGQFSLVDIAYAPFIERFKPFLLDVKEYDVTAGRPSLAAWIEEMDKNEAYKQTRRDPKELVEIYKKRFSAQP